VVPAMATSGEGVADVWDAVGEHREHLEARDELLARRRRRAADEITRVVAARLQERAAALTGGDRAASLAETVADGDLDPWSAADQLLDAGQLLDADHPAEAGGSPPGGQPSRMRAEPEA